MVLSRNTISDFELNFSFHVVHSFEKFHGSTTLYLKKDFSQLYFIANGLKGKSLKVLDIRVEIASIERFF